MSLTVAIETSTACCSVCVADEQGTLLAEIVSPDGPAHTRRLLPDLQHALAMVGAGAADVGTVLVGLGPGTFTGLRIGVATARALAQAVGADLVGVPSLEALLCELQLCCVGASVPAWAALIDGKRREVFAAVRPGGRQPAGVQPQEVAVDPRHPLVVAADDLTDLLGRWPGAVVGGDGAQLYCDQLPETVTRSPLVGPPTAAMILRAFSHGVPGLARERAAVVPIYGREPDARRWSARPGAGRHSSTGAASSAGGAP